MSADGQMSASLTGVNGQMPAGFTCEWSDVCWSYRCEWSDAGWSYMCEWSDVAGLTGVNGQIPAGLTCVHGLMPAGKELIFTQTNFFMQVEKRLQQGSACSQEGPEQSEETRQVVHTVTGGGVRDRGGAG